MLCFQIPERQYIWTALSARAKAHAWADIENLLTAKVNLYWLIYLIINIYIVTLQMKKNTITSWDPDVQHHKPLSWLLGQSSWKYTFSAVRKLSSSPS